MTNRSQTDAVECFWRWFAGNVEQLKALYLTSEFGRLAMEMNRRLDRIEPQLAWELGAGIKKPYLLTISAEGNPQIRQIADLVIERAPRLEEWEFYASRPARRAPGAVQLPESVERFNTSEWKFIPVEQHQRGQLDIVVVDDKLARADPGPALKAVSLYLDQMLGEEIVEAWIGTFRVESSVAAYGKRTFKMTELPDYLFRVMCRGKNAMKKCSRRCQ